VRRGGVAGWVRLGAIFTRLTPSHAYRTLYPTSQPSPPTPNCTPPTPTNHLQVLQRVYSQVVSIQTALLEFEWPSATGMVQDEVDEPSHEVVGLAAGEKEPPPYTPFEPIGMTVDRSAPPLRVSLHSLRTSSMPFPSRHVHLIHHTNPRAATACHEHPTAQTQPHHSHQHPTPTSTSISHTHPHSNAVPNVRRNIVSDVRAGSPSSKAGIRTGDTIVAIDGNCLRLGQKKVLRDGLAFGGADVWLRVRRPGPPKLTFGV
jgi:hypothetical protein